MPTGRTGGPTLRQLTMPVSPGSRPPHPGLLCPSGDWEPPLTLRRLDRDPPSPGPLADVTGLGAGGRASGTTGVAVGSD